MIIISKYEKPSIITNDEIAEVVYAKDSGGNSASTGTTQSKASCNSSYMGGTYHSSNYSDSQNGTNINGRGCEGCPANWSDGVCHIDNYGPQEDCRPTWEKQGKGPHDKWNG